METRFYNQNSQKKLVTGTRLKLLGATGEGNLCYNSLGEGLWLLILELFGPLLAPTPLSLFLLARDVCFAMRAPSAK